jgi:anaerobic magnesium-protoporphyrin IX monomethyl ester cyclase
MKELQESYGAEHLWFADDIFGLKQRWMTELADAAEGNAALIPFKIQSRVNLITAETATALRRSGCTEVWMGVESGSQKILDAMDKGTHVGQVPIARDNLRREGVRACFFLQFGYPGETWEDIEQTIQLVRRTRPDDIGVSVSYPLPGTTFYSRIQQELGEKRNWFDSDDLSVMFRGAYTSEFYRALRNALHAEVSAWSAPGCNGVGTKSLQAGLPRQAVGVTYLWDLVQRLEKTCRNPEPTLASCTRAV